MKKLLTFSILLANLIFVQIFASDGVIQYKSMHSGEETMKRLQQIVESKNMKIFGIVKHSDAAQENNISLRFTQLLIFGNPKIGSPLMECEQKIGIDLPQKALIWEDEKGITWISYNDPHYLVQRHKIQGCEKLISKIENALKTIIQSAASK